MRKCQSHGVPPVDEPRMAAAREAAESFNAACPLGTPVVWTDYDRQQHATEVAGEAFVTAPYRPACFLLGVGGFVPCDRVRPLKPAKRRAVKRG